MITENAGSSAQRIRIGLTGLAFAFLLVLLGSAISRQSSDAERGTANSAVSAVESQPNEPLAELGVAPGGADIGANNASSNR